VGRLGTLRRAVGSIYEQIGGMAAVSATVEELYARILGDAKLAPFFAGVDMAGRRRHMRAFVAAALGSPQVSDPSRPRHMAEAYAGLGVAGRDLDRVAGHLAGALRTIGVPSAQIATILARIAPLRDEVVGGEPAPV
jgi:hemoglobin